MSKPHARMVATTRGGHIPALPGIAPDLTHDDWPEGIEWQDADQPRPTPTTED